MVNFMKSKKKDDNHIELKEKFLEYYRQLPIQRLGADFIGVDQDTIINWKKKDKEFSDEIGKAKSNWALTHSKRITSSEWLLERILRDSFSPLPIQELMDRLDSIERKLGERNLQK